MFPYFDPSGSLVRFKTPAPVLTTARNITDFQHQASLVLFSFATSLFSTIYPHEVYCPHSCYSACVSFADLAATLVKSNALVHICPSMLPSAVRILTSTRQTEAGGVFVFLLFSLCCMVSFPSCDTIWRFHVTNIHFLFCLHPFCWRTCPTVGFVFDGAVNQRSSATPTLFTTCSHTPSSCIPTQ